MEDKLLKFVTEMVEQSLYLFNYSDYRSGNGVPLLEQVHLLLQEAHAQLQAYKEAKENKYLKMNDPVSHPSHYTSHPSGIEAIEITRHHNFAIGNAIKYLWRTGLKDGQPAIQDLEKAIWYIQDEIKRLKIQEELKRHATKMGTRVGKTCKDCGRTFPLDEEHWRWRDDGLYYRANARCITCQREYEKQKQRDLRARKAPATT